MSNHFLQKKWEDVLQTVKSMPWWEKKREELQNRNVKLLKVSGEGQVYHRTRLGKGKEELDYLLHLQLLLKQKDRVFLEEQVLPLQITVENREITSHLFKKESSNTTSILEKFTPELNDTYNQRSFPYDRRKAVQYAERWWNDYNPKYHHFENDCTNYVSQCLHAGGAKMWGHPNRSKGWWYSGTNWSYSWAVANALRWFLSSSTNGFAREVEHARDLLPGDVICYDFEGDGKWNHNTIVVAKDGYGEPLVNAHTVNSRFRYWKYEDSPAYTPNIQYKFFRIGQ
jgi:hypothetical protein